MRPFGYDFFEREELEAITTVPVPPDYIIGPGDEISVTIWGRLNAQYRLKVTREGKLFIPNIGVFTVAGLTFEEMKRLVEGQVKRITGANVAVTLESLRSIMVYVAGEVTQPGAYILSPVNTVLDALILAGGPKETGSLRKILLKRRGKEKRIDLYEFFLKGEVPRGIRLRHGDTVFVPVVGPRVKVVGAVKRPAIYELKKEKTPLSRVIELSGGLLPEAWTGRIQIERIVDHEKRIVLDVEAKKFDTVKNFLVVDGDLIKVMRVLKEKDWVVFLKGAVKRPGEYAWRPGLRIKDVIPSTEALLPEAYMTYALIKRFVPKKNTYEYKPFSPYKLFVEGDEKENLELKPRDEIVIFNKKKVEGTKKVYILGAVYRPGDYEWLPGMRVADLIKIAGGLRRFAYPEGELIRRIPTKDGVKTELIKIDLHRALQGDPRHNLLLEEEDTLTVRAVPEWYEIIKAKIEGEVRFPGVYVIRKGERLSSLIERAGGFTEKAYLKGAKFIRKSVKEKQKKFIEDLISRIEMELLRASAETGVAVSKEALEARKAEIQAKQAFIAKLKSLKPTGRMVIHLAPPEKLKGTPYDIVLEDGDYLYVPQKPSTITVEGAVFNPGAFVFDPKRTYRDYIRLAGGYLDIADKNNIYLLKVDGSAMRLKKKFFAMVWDPETKRWTRDVRVELDPGDTIVVPYKIRMVPWLRNIKDITQIIYQLAVTTGVVITTF